MAPRRPFHRRGGASLGRQQLPRTKTQSGRRRRRRRVRHRRRRAGRRARVDGGTRIVCDFVYDRDAGHAGVPLPSSLTSGTTKIPATHKRPPSPAYFVPRGIRHPHHAWGGGGGDAHDGGALPDTEGRRMVRSFFYFPLHTHSLRPPLPFPALCLGFCLPSTLADAFAGNSSQRRRSECNGNCYMSLFASLPSCFIPFPVHLSIRSFPIPYFLPCPFGHAGNSSDGARSATEELLSLPFASLPRRLPRSFLPCPIIHSFIHSPPSTPTLSVSPSLSLLAPSATHARSIAPACCNVVGSHGAGARSDHETAGNYYMLSAAPLPLPRFIHLFLLVILIRRKPTLSTLSFFPLLLPLPLYYPSPTEPSTS
ncbi:hypothetical protein C8R46DRAFT_597711 [Mycena filopes]|nr:hypothetical protein C8R46DRAFT_597711 [Mycena filopes]